MFTDSRHRTAVLSSSSYYQTVYVSCIWLTQSCSLSDLDHTMIHHLSESRPPLEMKSTKVQNPRRILHILRSMPMRVHRACAGLGQKLYACALFIIDGLGHATWSSKAVLEGAGFSTRNGAFLAKSPHYFSSACCARAVVIAHEPVWCL